MQESNTGDSHSYARLLSLAVHEFRTPASIVGGYLHMMQSGVGGALADGHKKMVSEAEKSCARLVELIGELSEIGKLDSGSLALGEDHFDLFALVRDVASDMHEAVERDVRLELRGASTGGPVVGDRTRLSRAFSVLFRSVLREQPSAATVIGEQRLEQNGDTSCGVILIAREDYVQETYNACRMPLDELRGGLGLGLPLARRIIERHRGQVWSPGNGADADSAGTRAGIIVSIPVEP